MPASPTSRTLSSSIRPLSSTSRHTAAGTLSGRRHLPPARQTEVISLDSDSDSSEPSSGSLEEAFDLPRVTQQQPSTPAAYFVSNPPYNASSSGHTQHRVSQQKGSSSVAHAIDLTAEDSMEVVIPVTGTKRKAAAGTSSSTASKGKGRSLTSASGKDGSSSFRGKESSKQSRASSQSSLAAPIIFAGPDYEEDLTCPICYDVFLDPVNISCGHVFCFKCATDCLEQSRECPVCRQKSHGDPSRALVLCSIVERFLKGQVDLLELKGEDAAAKALRNARAAKVQEVQRSQSRPSRLDQVVHQASVQSRQRLVPNHPLTRPYPAPYGGPLAGHVTSGMQHEQSFGVHIPRADMDMYHISALPDATYAIASSPSRQGDSLTSQQRHNRVSRPRANQQAGLSLPQRGIF